MKRLLQAGFIILILAPAFFACKENDLEKMRQNELERLSEYINLHYQNEEPKQSGLYFIPVKENTDTTEIKPGDRVQVFYATWAFNSELDSILLDETSGYTDGYRYEPYEFIVGGNSAIQGLQEAVTYMTKGEVANLVIPSELAYAQTGSAGIAPFTTLLMQVEIYKVYPAPVQEEQ